MASAVSSGGGSGSKVRVICDLDGTLLDTEPAYYAAYAAVAAAHGASYTPEFHVRHLLGRAEVAGAATMIAELGIVDGLTPHSLLEERDTHLLDEFLRVGPLPGAVDLLSRLAAAGVPIAIATSSCRKYLALKMRNNAALFDHVAAIVCGDDAAVGGKSKPDPAIFVAAQAALAEAVGSPAPASSHVVLEDAPAGMRAGKAAGMRVVAVPDVRLPADVVADAAPDLVLASLAAVDLAAHLGV